VVVVLMIVERAYKGGKGLCILSLASLLLTPTVFNGFGLNSSSSAQGFLSKLPSELVGEFPNESVGEEAQVWDSCNLFLSKP
jgi:hypothetical protein